MRIFYDTEFHENGSTIGLLVRAQALDQVGGAECDAPPATETDVVRQAETS
ncbi:hypothetical protein [Streptomyces triticagri]|uniref:hypothetical protein n=1 Tax=Streptomyces triticagri TaxID=2293568 RepID=UPI0013148B0F|nr:hypothetical protein [Streptomyces triticagri]